MALYRCQKQQTVRIFIYGGLLHKSSIFAAWISILATVSVVRVMNEISMNSVS